MSKLNDKVLELWEDAFDKMKFNKDKKEYYAGKVVAYEKILELLEEKKDGVFDCEVEYIDENSNIIDIIEDVSYIKKGKRFESKLVEDFGNLKEVEGYEEYVCFYNEVGNILREFKSSELVRYRKVD